MAFKIEWTINARLDRKEIFTYWNNRNKSNIYSRKLNNLFNTHVESLLKFPSIGKLTDYEQVRFLIVKDYLIFYKIEQQIISIVKIWDSRQDPNKVKNILKD